MISTFAAFFVVMALGALWRAFPSLPAPLEVRRNLTAVVLNIFLPALAFKAIVTAPLSLEVLLIPLLAAGACLAGVVLAVGIYGGRRQKLWRIQGQQTGALVLAAAWSNATYLGLPTLSSLYGTQAERYAIFYDILALTPLLLTVGAILSSRYGSALPKGVSIVRSGIIAALRLPPLWAAAAALLWNVAALPLPDFMLSTLSMMSAPVAPLMIFAVGLALKPIAWRRVPLLLPAAAIKLVLLPAGTLALVSLLPLSEEAAAAVTLEAGMPTMVLTIAIADRFNLDAELLAQAIAFSTVFSFLTLPSIKYLFF